MHEAASLSTVPPQPTRPRGPERAVGPAVQRLLDSPDPAGEAARLWSALDHTPLAEPDPDDPDTAIVTFLWRGGDECAEVLLVANKLTDASTYETSRFDRVDGTDVWHLGLRMRHDWRGSYALAVVPSGPCEPTLPRDRLAGLERRRERSLAVTPPERHTSASGAGITRCATAAPIPWPRRPSMPGARWPHCPTPHRNRGWSRTRRAPVGGCRPGP